MKFFILFLVVLAVVVSLEARPAKVSTKQKNEQAQALAGGSVSGSKAKKGKGKAVTTTHAPEHHDEEHHEEHHHMDELPVPKESSSGAKKSAFESGQIQGKNQKVALSTKKEAVAISQKDGQAQSVKGLSKHKNSKAAKMAKQKQKQSQSVDVQTD